MAHPSRPYHTLCARQKERIDSFVGLASLEDVSTNKLSVQDASERRLSLVQVHLDSMRLRNMF
jgi:hypothetical protein